MSQEKAQLIAPLGNMTVPGVTATGVITATSFEGNIAGSASSIKQGTSISAGVVTASSFVGNLTGNIQRLADSGPNISVGVVTATSFSGNLTGSVTDLTSAPAITVGVVTATTLKGPVTGNITGNVSGTAGGLGVNYNGGWTGAGTSQISVGVITATVFHGDGSNLDGVSSGPVSQQAVTINGASTTIDLSNGNLIYASQSANTTVSFANSENGNVYFVRVKDATTTTRTITWPDRIKWDGGTAPTLIGSNSTDEAQIFLLVTRDMGVTWYGKEIYGNAGGSTLWAWGYNNYGSLGQNDILQRSSPCQVMSSNAWTMTGSERCQVNMHKNDGTMWVWGWNADIGALGLNEAVGKYSSPVQLGTAATWVNNVGDQGGCHAVKTDGTLWTWGSGGGGMLGQNNTTQYSSPTQVGTDTNWSSGLNKFDRSGAMAAAIRTNGTLWTWGYNPSGILGQGDTTEYSSPRQVGTDTTWSHVMALYSSAIATKTDGTLWTWGLNNYGALGHNQAHPWAYSSPKQVGTDTTWTLTNVYAAKQGQYFGIAGKTDGTFWSWGYNAQGQLADNSRTDRSSPVQIPGTWSHICLGQQNGTGVKTDGTLWAWGYNFNGSLGQNNLTKYSSPTQIPGTNWTMVVNNGTRTFATKS